MAAISARMTITDHAKIIARVLQLTKKDEENLTVIMILSSLDHLTASLRRIPADAKTKVNKYFIEKTSGLQTFS